MRKLIGSAVGLVLLALDSFEGGHILELLGWASLPDEIREWGHGVLWTSHHFALWLPIGLGLAIILWAHWGWVKMQIKDRKWRNAAIIAILGISFFLSGLPEGGAQTTPPEKSAAQPAPQTGNATGPGSNGINNGTQYNFFNPPQKTPLKVAPAAPINAGPCSSINQKGGSQTFNCKFQGQPSEVRVLGQMATVDEPDGTVTVPVVIDVHPQIPLIATACGDEVQDVNLVVMTGIFNFGPQSIKSGNCVSAFYDGVYGEWVMKVRTKTKMAKFQVSFREARP